MTTRCLTTEAWRLTQMWDWGHNCKVLGQTEEQARDARDSMGEFSVAERDRFWEGFNAPRSRATLVSINITALES